MKEYEDQLFIFVEHDMLNNKNNTHKKITLLILFICNKFREDNQIID